MVKWWWVKWCLGLTLNNLKWMAVVMFKRFYAQYNFGWFFLFFKTLLIETQIEQLLKMLLGYDDGKWMVLIFRCMFFLVGIVAWNSRINLRLHNALPNWCMSLADTPSALDDDMMPPSEIASPGSPPVFFSSTVGDCNASQGFLRWPRRPCLPPHRQC